MFIDHEISDKFVHPFACLYAYIQEINYLKASEEKSRNYIIHTRLGRFTMLMVKCLTDARLDLFKVGKVVNV